MPSLLTVNYHPEKKEKKKKKKKKKKVNFGEFFSNRFLNNYYLKNKGECFMRFPNTRKQMKRPSDFIVFQCLET